MTLDDFLKCKKVRCVKAYGDCLTVGKEYGVIDIRMEVKVKDDEGDNYYWESDHFEPVLEPAENPLQNIELTPEFETVAPVLADNCEVNIQDIGTDILDTNADIKDTPKFKVGDKVYKYGETDVKTVLEVFENGYMNISNYPYRVNHEVICHATPENHALLSKPFPAIEFEKPLKLLTGSDLTRAMLDKGWKYVPCFVGNESDDFAQKTKLTDLIFALDGDRSKEFVGDDVWKYAVPIDLRTGLPLTESILND